MDGSSVPGAIYERTRAVASWLTYPAVSAAGPGHRSAVRPVVMPPASSSGGTSISSRSFALANPTTPGLRPPGRRESYVVVSRQNVTRSVRIPGNALIRGLSNRVLETDRSNSGFD